jgi:hypothetical protein
MTSWWLHKTAINLWSQTDLLLMACPSPHDHFSHELGSRGVTHQQAEPDRYHWQHFTYLSRALQQSVKLALMIEANGFLSVQIMMPVTQGTNLGEHNGIIDFKVCPLSWKRLAESRSS